MKSVVARVLLLVGGVASGALSVYVTRLAMLPDPAPDGLQAVVAVQDLGRVAQGLSRASFELVNSSGHPISIAHIVKTCRCTDVQIRSKELAAGARTIVECGWDTGGLRGRCASTFSVCYFLPGKDPELKQLPLYMQADVVPVFNYFPQKLEFLENKATTATIQLEPTDSSGSVAIVAANCSHPAFTIVSLTTRSVKVAFVPDAWPRGVRLSPELSIETDCKTERNLTIPLRIVSK
jgi:hypothetical protein